MGMLSFFELEKRLPETDLWEKLKVSGKKIVMYGMGNGADKIIRVLDGIGLEVSDFFASDAFVRGQYFHGKKVMKFEEICEKYDDFTVLVSFGSELDEVIANIERINAAVETYLPDVPVAGEELFTLDFFNKNRERLRGAFESLSDARSREVFADVVLYKLTGKLECLLAHTNSDSEVYGEFFDGKKIERAVDLGAYNGDSALFMCDRFENLKEIIAFEPDKKNFTKLCRNTEGAKVIIEAHNKCAWSENATLAFDRGGNRNSSVSSIGHEPSVGDTKKVVVEGESVDSAVGERHVDFIKYDVEGSELEALVGSEKTLKRCKPDILVSAYHRSDDLFVLFEKLHEVLPEHKLYLRRKRCVPAWEISLICQNK